MNTPQREKRPASPPLLPTKRAPIVGWLVPVTGPIEMHRDVLVDDYGETDFLILYDAWRRDRLGSLASEHYEVLELDNSWCIAFDPAEDLPPNESMISYLGTMCKVGSGPVGIFRREESSDSVRPLQSIGALFECDSFYQALTHPSRKLQ